MQYFVTFLEGLISFLSPCMLPMLPVYLSYFAGNADKKQGQFSRSLAFVLGFSPCSACSAFLQGRSEPF